MISTLNSTLEKKVTYQDTKDILILTTPTGLDYYPYINIKYLVPDEKLNSLLSSPIQELNLNELNKDCVRFSILDNDPTVMTCTYNATNVNVNNEGFDRNINEYSREFIETYFDLVKSNTYSFSDARYNRIGLYKIKKEKLKNLVDFKIYSTNQNLNSSHSIFTTPELISKYNKLSKHNISIDERVDLIIKAFNTYSNNTQAREALMDLQLSFFTSRYKNSVLALDSPYQHSKDFIDYSSINNNEVNSIKLALQEMKESDNGERLVGILDLRLYK